MRELARDRLGAYAGITAEVLLLGGESSPEYLRTAMNAIAAALPHARRIVLPGLGHGAMGNRRFGGKPTVVAGPLRQFFSD